MTSAFFFAAPAAPCVLCASPVGTTAKHLCDPHARAMAAESHAGLLAADAAAEDARTYKAMAEAIVEGCTPTAQGFGGAA